MQVMFAPGAQVLGIFWITGHIVQYAYPRLRIVAAKEVHDALLVYVEVVRRLHGIHTTAAVSKGHIHSAAGQSILDQLSVCLTDHDRRNANGARCSTHSEYLPRLVVHDHSCHSTRILCLLNLGNKGARAAIDECDPAIHGSGIGEWFASVTQRGCVVHCKNEVRCNRYRCQ